MEHLHKPFLKDSQPKPAQPFAQSVGGSQIGDKRYSIRVVGYQYGEVAIIQHVQLLCDGKVEQQELNTVEGREEIKKFLILAHEGWEHWTAPDLNWLLGLVDTIAESKGAK